ncbi:MAG: hypothetical protein ACOYON_02885 [Fimbriimonas sp.]
MKLRTIGTTIVLILCCALAGAQATGDQKPKTLSERSEAILKDIRRMDLLRHILPLALSKSQYNDVLGAIEKAQENVKKIEKSEAEELIKREEKARAVVVAALEKGSYPDRAALNEIIAVLRAFSIRRNVAANENVDLVYQVVEKKFNAGQKKVLANSIDYKEIDPTLKEAPDDQTRIRFIIRDVLLDPLAYDLMVQLMKKAS